MRAGFLDNTPLREAFLASGLDAADVAREAGFIDTRKSAADRSRLRRVLGLARWADGHGNQGIQARISVENARRVAQAIDVELEDLYPHLSAPPCGERCNRCDEELLLPALLCGWCIAEAEDEAGKVAA